MKIKILFLALICCIPAFFQGCRKDESKDTSYKTINVTTKANQTYQYDLGAFGIEEGAIITRQGTHFQVSKLERTGMEKIIYTYIPIKDYTGTDEVELKAERGSDGASPNNKIIVYTFKITVTH